MAADLIGQLRCCADFAKKSPDDWTHLNDAARVMLKESAAEIERLKAERDEWKDAAELRSQTAADRLAALKKLEPENERLRALDAEACRDRDTWHAIADAKEKENERLRSLLGVALAEHDDNEGQYALDHLPHHWSHQARAELRGAYEQSAPGMTPPWKREEIRSAFEEWIEKSGAFTDWTRYGEGYAKPLVDRTWHAWAAAAIWAHDYGQSG